MIGTAQRLPAEWEPQAGVMLAWPHESTDWADMLAAVELTYLDIASIIAQHERLLIVCREWDHRARISERLRARGVNPDRVCFAMIPFNDTWIRDYGPVTILAGREPRLLDFGFNAWGGKYAASLDDAVTRSLHDRGVFGDAPLKSIPLVLEGGSIDVDGAGGLLTTSRCLLSPTRNPDLDRHAVESRLRTLLGAERVLWLEHGGLAGDDTDSHIDMLARFCDAETIAYTACRDPADEHYEPLCAMKAQLECLHTGRGAPYRLIELPLPAAARNGDGQRLPASYSNFLIINGAVLLPTYGDPADAIAAERLQPAFPDRRIIGIDCTPLIQQYGSLHCMTMQLPDGVIINDASRTGPARQQR